MKFKSSTIQSLFITSLFGANIICTSEAFGIWPSASSNIGRVSPFPSSQGYQKFSHPSSTLTATSSNGDEEETGNFGTSRKDIEEETGKHVGFKIHTCPSKEDTGVEESITRLAAAMSGQIYAHKDTSSFDVSTKDTDAEVVVCDNHEGLSVALPTFAAAVSGKTMVLAWQGSATLMNFVTDASIPPVSSNRWSGISRDVKVQGGFYSLIESDITNNEVDLIKYMTEHGVTELITTGHSLGGGLAQVAQVCIEGELAKEGSIWKEYKDKVESEGGTLKTKTVAFSAPMSIVNMANSDDNSAEEFLEKIEANSCNIIYSTDPVPRCYAYLEFIEDAVKEAIVDLAVDQYDSLSGIKKVGASIIAGRYDLTDGGLNEKVQENFADVIKKADQGALFDVARKYRHYGKIISYKDDTATPEIYKDYGPEVMSGSPDGIKNFRDIKWEKTPDAIGFIGHNHLMTVRGPGLGYNIPESHIEVKLNHMHERAMLKDQNDVGEPIRVNGWEDCRKKAKEHLISASMGAVVVWDKPKRGKEMWEGEGWMYVKENLPKLSVNADWEKDGGGIIIKRDLLCTSLWRTPALGDKIQD